MERRPGRTFFASLLLGTFCAAAATTAPATQPATQTASTWPSSPAPKMYKPHWLPGTATNEDAAAIISKFPKDLMPPDGVEDAMSKRGFGVREWADKNV